MTTHRRRLGLSVFGVGIAAAVLSADAITGPNSSASPYLLRALPGVVSKAILTVGDSVGAYRLVGIPDGLGAFDNGNGTFTLLVNHEIPQTLGVTRAHGAKGAFVSKWIIRKDDLGVIDGSDLIQEVATWNVATGFWNAPEKGVLNVALLFRRPATRVCTVRRAERPGLPGADPFSMEKRSVQARKDGSSHI